MPRGRLHHERRSSPLGLQNFSRGVLPHGLPATRPCHADNEDRVEEVVRVLTSQHQEPYDVQVTFRDKRWQKADSGTPASLQSLSSEDEASPGPRQSQYSPRQHRVRRKSSDSVASVQEKDREEPTYVFTQLQRSNSKTHDGVTRQGGLGSMQKEHFPRHPHGERGQPRCFRMRQVAGCERCEYFHEKRDESQKLSQRVPMHPDENRNELEYASKPETKKRECSERFPTPEVFGVDANLDHRGSRSKSRFDRRHRIQAAMQRRSASVDEDCPPTFLRQVSSTEAQEAQDISCPLSRKLPSLPTSRTVGAHKVMERPYPAQTGNRKHADVRYRTSPVHVQTKIYPLQNRQTELEYQAVPRRKSVEAAEDETCFQPQRPRRREHSSHPQNRHCTEGFWSVEYRHHSPTPRSVESMDHFGTTDFENDHRNCDSTYTAHGCKVSQRPIAQRREQKKRTLRAFDPEDSGCTPRPVEHSTHYYTAQSEDVRCRTLGKNGGLQHSAELRNNNVDIHDSAANLSSRVCPGEWPASIPRSRNCSTRTREERNRMRQPVADAAACGFPQIADKHLTQRRSAPSRQGVLLGNENSLTTGRTRLCTSISSTLCQPLPPQSSTTMDSQPIRTPTESSVSLRPQENRREIPANTIRYEERSASDDVVCGRALSVPRKIRPSSHGHRETFPTPVVTRPLSGRRAERHIKDTLRVSDSVVQVMKLPSDSEMEATDTVLSYSSDRDKEDDYDIKRGRSSADALWHSDAQANHRICRKEWCELRVLSTPPETRQQHTHKPYHADSLGSPGHVLCGQCKNAIESNNFATSSCQTVLYRLPQQRCQDCQTPLESAVEKLSPWSWTGIKVPTGACTASLTPELESTQQASGPGQPHLPDTCQGAYRSCQPHASVQPRGLHTVSFPHETKSIQTVDCDLLKARCKSCQVMLIQPHTSQKCRTEKPCVRRHKQRSTQTSSEPYPSQSHDTTSTSQPKARSKSVRVRTRCQQEDAHHSPAHDSPTTSGILRKRSSRSPPQSLTSESRGSSTHGRNRGRKSRLTTLHEGLQPAGTAQPTRSVSPTTNRHADLSRHRMESRTHSHSMSQRKRQSRSLSKAVSKSPKGKKPATKHSTLHHRDHDSLTQARPSGLAKRRAHFHSVSKDQEDVKDLKYKTTDQQRESKSSSSSLRHIPRRESPKSVAVGNTRKSKKANVPHSVGCHAATSKDTKRVSTFRETVPINSKETRHSSQSVEAGLRRELKNSGRQQAYEQDTSSDQAKKARRIRRLEEESKRLLKSEEIRGWLQADESRRLKEVERASRCKESEKARRSKVDAKIRLLQEAREIRRLQEEKEIRLLLGVEEKSRVQEKKEIKRLMENENVRRVIEDEESRRLREANEARRLQETKEMRRVKEEEEIRRLVQAEKTRQLRKFEEARRLERGKTTRLLKASEEFKHLKDAEEDKSASEPVLTGLQGTKMKFAPSSGTAVLGQSQRKLLETRSDEQPRTFPREQISTAIQAHGLHQLFPPKQVSAASQTNLPSHRLYLQEEMRASSQTSERPHVNSEADPSKVTVPLLSTERGKFLSEASVLFRTGDASELPQEPQRQFSKQLEPFIKTSAQNETDTRSRSSRDSAHLTQKQLDESGQTYNRIQTKNMAAVTNSSEPNTLRLLEGHEQTKNETEEVLESHEASTELLAQQSNLKSPTYPQTESMSEFLKNGLIYLRQLYVSNQTSAQIQTDSLSELWRDSTDALLTRSDRRVAAQEKACTRQTVTKSDKGVFDRTSARTKRGKSPAVTVSTAPSPRTDETVLKQSHSESGSESTESSTRVVPASAVVVEGCGAVPARLQAKVTMEPPKICVFLDDSTDETQAVRTCGSPNVPLLYLSLELGASNETMVTFQKEEASAAAGRTASPSQRQATASGDEVKHEYVSREIILSPPTQFSMWSQTDSESRTEHDNLPRDTSASNPPPMQFEVYSQTAAPSRAEIKCKSVQFCPLTCHATRQGVERGPPKQSAVKQIRDASDLVFSAAPQHTPLKRERAGCPESFTSGRSSSSTASLRHPSRHCSVSPTDISSSSLSRRVCHHRPMARKLLSSSYPTRHAPGHDEAARKFGYTSRQINFNNKIIADDLPRPNSCDEYGPFGNIGNHSSHNSLECDRDNDHCLQCRTGKQMPARAQSAVPFCSSSRKTSRPLSKLCRLPAIETPNSSIAPNSLSDAANTTSNGTFPKEDCIFRAAICKRPASQACYCSRVCPSRSASYQCARKGDAGSRAAPLGSLENSKCTTSPSSCSSHFSSPSQRTQALRAWKTRSCIRSCNSRRHKFPSNVRFACDVGKIFTNSRPKKSVGCCSSRHFEKSSRFTSTGTSPRFRSTSMQIRLEDSSCPCSTSDSREDTLVSKRMVTAQRRCGGTAGSEKPQDDLQRALLGSLGQLLKAIDFTDDASCVCKETLENTVCASPPLPICIQVDGNLREAAERISEVASGSCRCSGQKTWNAARPQTDNVIVNDETQGQFQPCHGGSSMSSAPRRSDLCMDSRQRRKLLDCCCQADNRPKATKSSRRIGFSPCEEKSPTRPCASTITLIVQCPSPKNSVGKPLSSTAAFRDSTVQTSQMCLVQLCLVDPSTRKNSVGETFSSKAALCDCTVDPSSTRKNSVGETLTSKAALCDCTVQTSQMCPVEPRLVDPSTRKKSMGETLTSKAALSNCTVQTSQMCLVKQSLSQTITTVETYYEIPPPRLIERQDSPAASCGFETIGTGLWRSGGMNSSTHIPPSAKSSAQSGWDSHCNYSLFSCDPVSSPPISYRRPAQPEYRSGIERRRPTLSRHESMTGGSRRSLGGFEQAYSDSGAPPKVESRPSRPRGYSGCCEQDHRDSRASEQHMYQVLPRVESRTSRSRGCSDGCEQEHWESTSSAQERYQALPRIDSRTSRSRGCLNGCEQAPWKSRASVQQRYQASTRINSRTSRSRGCSNGCEQAPWKSRASAQQRSQAPTRVESSTSRSRGCSDGCEQAPWKSRSSAQQMYQALPRVESRPCRSRRCSDGRKQAPWKSRASAQQRSQAPTRVESSTSRSRGCSDGCERAHWESRASVQQKYQSPPRAESRTSRCRRCSDGCDQVYSCHRSSPDQMYPGRCSLSCIKSRTSGWPRGCNCSEMAYSDHRTNTDPSYPRPPGTDISGCGKRRCSNGVQTAYADFKAQSQQSSPDSRENPGNLSRPCSCKTLSRYASTPTCSVSTSLGGTKSSLQRNKRSAFSATSNQFQNIPTLSQPPLSVRIANNPEIFYRQSSESTVPMCCVTPSPNRFSHGGGTVETQQSGEAQAESSQQMAPHGILRRPSSPKSECFTQPCHYRDHRCPCTPQHSACRQRVCPRTRALSPSSNANHVKQPVYSRTSFQPSVNITGGTQVVQPNLSALRCGYDMSGWQQRYFQPGQITYSDEPEPAYCSYPGSSSQIDPTPSPASYPNNQTYPVPSAAVYSIQAPEQRQTYASHTMRNTMDCPWFRPIPEAQCYELNYAYPYSYAALQTYQNPSNPVSAPYSATQTSPAICSPRNYSCNYGHHEDQSQVGSTSVSTVTVGKRSSPDADVSASSTLKQVSSGSRHHKLDGESSRLQSRLKKNLLRIHAKALRAVEHGKTRGRPRRSHRFRHRKDSSGKTSPLNTNISSHSCEGSS